MFHSRNELFVTSRGYKLHNIQAGFLLLHRILTFLFANKCSLVLDLNFQKFYQNTLRVYLFFQVTTMPKYQLSV